MTESPQLTVIDGDGKSAERQARSSALRQAGYRVVEASNEAEVLSLANQERPALVLLNTENSERFRTLVDRAPALMWMNGSDGCEFVNRAYLDLLGVSDVDVRGFDLAHYVHPDDREGYVTAYLEAVVARKVFEATVRCRRYDGVYRWMKSVGTPQFSDDGTFLGCVGSTIDVTDLQPRAFNSLPPIGTDSDRRRDCTSGFESLPHGSRWRQPVSLVSYYWGGALVSRGSPAFLHSSSR